MSVILRYLSCLLLAHNFSGAQCDLADLINGRLFLVVLPNIQGCANTDRLLTEKIIKEFGFFASIIRAHSGIQVQISAKRSLIGKALLPPPEPTATPSVLPFSNVVFGKLLACRGLTSR